MSKQSVQDFLAKPNVKQVLNKGGKKELGLLAMATANLKKDGDLYAFGKSLVAKS